MDIRFAGQSVIVTGAVRGIGRGIAHGFAARGATVYACDILADGLREVADAAAPAGGGALHPRPLDVTDGAAVRALVDEVAAASPRGRVDVAVHSAGGVRGQTMRPIEEVTAEQWRAIQAVNVDGAFNLARAVAPAMKRTGGGRILVIASRAGLRPSLTGIQSYCTAKHGQIGLVRQLAHELGRFGITVNAVAPGFMPTSPDYVRQWESYGEDGRRRLVEGIAMRRLGRPGDIAHAVLFLASDYAEWITGQVLQVTGSP